jgi:AraC-like DNA-binding protein
MLEIERIEDLDCFIPNATMTGFLTEVERRTGEAHLGLMLAPHLTLASYGCWGEYVLGGETLGAAVARAVAAGGYHSRGDRTLLTVDGAAARLAYLSAARGRPGYPHVAVGAVGVILSLCRAYAGPGWRPLSIELDIARPRAAGRFEEAFLCPVRFDAPAAAVAFAGSLLDAGRRPGPRARLLTIEDVARARLDPVSRDGLMGAVSAQIRAQVLAGSVSLDGAARALDLSVRTLQRALNRNGTDFRSLANAIRARRAAELLRGTRASVTEISYELGYSTPANFARAFRNATGLAPDAFRRSLRPESPEAR